MKYARASLMYPPPHLVAGEDYLHSIRREWIQDSGWWMLIIYRHRGLATINSISHSFEDGSAILYPPGVRGTHGVVGKGTPHIYFNFQLRDDAHEVMALPIRQQLDPELVNKCSQKAELIVHRFSLVQAFFWDFLWSIAAETRLLEADDKLLDAESFIEKNVGRQITVGDVCDAVDMPYRSLGRLFEAEHGTGIKGYIMRRKANEAVRLISETVLPLKVIAGKVGVPDPHQFNKLIRRAVGVGPRAVRGLASQRRSKFPPE